MTIYKQSNNTCYDANEKAADFTSDVVPPTRRMGTRNVVVFLVKEDMVEASMQVCHALYSWLSSQKLDRQHT